VTIFRAVVMNRRSLAAEVRIPFGDGADAAGNRDFHFAAHRQQLVAKLLELGFIGAIGVG